MRMISALDRRGFHELADSIVAEIVPGEAHEAVETARVQFSAAPPSLTEPQTAETRARPPKARARARRREDDTEKVRGDLSTIAAAIAETYLQTAARLKETTRALEAPAAVPMAAETSGPPAGPPTPTGPQWRSLGPWTIPNGQTYGASRVNVSGRVSAIAIHPANPARVLCGAANGGVWESFDRGASWTPRTDYAATLTVGAIAYDRPNPAVYCGTGEGNWWSWLGAGVLRSTDGGTSWATLCTAPFVGQGFYDLRWARDSKRLVAATTGGLYVSPTAAWLDQRRAPRPGRRIAPGRPRAEILAACRTACSARPTAARPGRASRSPAPGDFDRLAVAIAPSNPGVAYVWGARAPPRTFRRSAGTGERIGPPGVSTGQAWYDWYLAVAPDRDNQVYRRSDRVYRGELSGATWTWPNLSNKGRTGDSIHPDQHAIAFEPGPTRSTSATTAASSAARIAASTG